MHTLVRVKNAYTVMTICLIALGAALLFAPQLGLRTLCVVYGVFLIVYGVTKLSGYFAKDLFQLAFQFDLALGIVSIVLGIIIIKKTEYIIEILSTAIRHFYVGRWSVQDTDCSGSKAFWHREMVAHTRDVVCSGICGNTASCDTI